jgi:hypothetical protein
MKTVDVMRHNANAIRYMPWRHVPRAARHMKLSPWRSCDRETRKQARCTRQRRRRADLPLGYMTERYALPYCWSSLRLLGMQRVIAGRGSLYGFCNAREHLDRLGVLGGEVITALLLRWCPTLYTSWPDSNLWGLRTRVMFHRP